MKVQRASPSDVPRTFVGRERELTELSRSLDTATGPTGSGRVFLLTGEPGIGKTTLANAAAEHAMRHGFEAYWGRCWEGGGAPAYWPWIQVLRRCARERDLTALGPAFMPALQRIGTIVAPFADATGGSGSLPSPEHDESAPSRFALFDAVSTVLQRLADDHPMLLVLDDLHAADHDSLQLLQFLARDVESSRLVVVATYRAEEAERSGATAFFTAVARDGQAIQLRGLSEAEVADCVERIAGEQARSHVVNALHQATGGNPFFVGAVTRMLMAEERLHDEVIGNDLAGVTSLPIPSDVRDVIRARLSTLPAATVDALRMASVIGRGFTIATLGAMTATPVPELLETLRPAIEWAVLAPSQQTPGGYLFDHMLVRDTLYRELAPRTRAESHERVGEALQRLHADELEPHLGELAHHFLLALPTGDADRAIEFAERAAQRSLDLAAYDEAASLYEQALRALDAGGANAHRRCELLLGLGAARTRGGDTTGGRAVFLDAAALARELGEPEQLADAALGYAGKTGFHFSGRVDGVLVALLEEALAALPAGDSAARVQLLGRLSVALYWTDLHQRRDALSEEAVAMARRLNDPATLAMAIHSRRYAQWGPDDFERRLADGGQCVQLALEANDLELAVSAHKWRLTDLLELGDIMGVDREIMAHGSLAQRLHQPFQAGQTTQFQALRAIMRGRFDEGERLAAEARREGERVGNPLAHAVYAMQLLPVWRLQKRHQELSDVLGPAMAALPAHASVTARFALLDAELGDHAAANALVEQLVGDDLKDLRRDMMFLHVLAFITLVCAETGDDAHVERVYEMLAPYPGRIVVSGAPVLACWGPVDHYLGVLAALGGDADRAAQHFDAALKFDVRLGSPPLLAETRYEYGRLLRMRDLPDDRRRADALLTAAADTATIVGMPRLSERIDVLRAADGGSAAVASVPVTAPGGPVERIGDDDVPSSTRPDDHRSPSIPSLTAEGDYWTVQTASGVFRLKDMKGLHHLATLLANPRRRCHVIELSTVVDPDRQASPAASTAAFDETGGGYSLGFGDAGEILDEEAKRAYRERLLELDDVIAEAEANNDTERASRHREERDLLIDQLAQAVGLGGRSRRAASNEERARVNVTRAIRSAIRRITDRDADLGRFLDATIVTGTYCVFDPDQSSVHRL